MADRSVRVVLSAVVSSFQAGMKSAANSARGLESAISKNSSQLDTLSAAATVSGAAILAGVGMAVKAYADFDQAMSKVSATGQDAKNSFDSLRAAALQAGADTKYSATEAAAGIENLLKAGVASQDVLGGGLTGALSLAAAGEMGVADAAEVAATAMTQFKLSGSEIPHVADLLAAGAGKAQGEVSDLAMALKQSGLVASQFGVSVDETVGTLAAFASAGLLGSDAGTSFKQMLLSLSNPSKQSAILMDELGIKAYDAQGKFVGLTNLAGQLQTKLSGLTDEQRQAALATMFGSDAVRAASVLYDQGAAGIENWTQQVNDQGYAAQVAAEKTNNLAGDLERLRGSIETALIGAGESANSPLRLIVQNLTDLVNVASTAPPGLQAVGLGIAGLGGSGLLAVGGLIKVAQTVAELKSALTVLNLTAGTAAGALGAIGAVAGIAGAAFTIWISKQAEAKAASDALKASLDQQSGAITQLTNVQMAKTLQDEGAFVTAKKLGLSTKDVTDAALGNAAAQAKVNAAADQAIAKQNALSDSNSLYTSQATRSITETEKFRDAVLGHAGALADDQKRMLEASVAAGNLGDAYATIPDKINAMPPAMQQASLAMLTGVGELTAAISNMQGTVTVNGNTIPAQDIVAMLISSIDTSTGMVTINGQAVPAENALSTVLSLVDSGQGTITIGGDAAPANTATDGATSYANGSWGSINVDANTASAESAINNAARPRTATISLSVTATADAWKLLRGTHSGGWIAPGLHEGGFVPGSDPGYDNVLWPLHSGGTTLYQPLAGGEYVVNSADAEYWARALEWINSGGRLPSRSALSPNSASLGGGGTNADAAGIAVAVRSALDGARIELSGANAFADSISGRVVLAAQRRAGVR